MTNLKPEDFLKPVRRTRGKIFLVIQGDAVSEQKTTIEGSKSYGIRLFHSFKNAFEFLIHYPGVYKKLPPYQQALKQYQERNSFTIKYKLLEIEDDEMIIPHIAVQILGMPVYGYDAAKYEKGFFEVVRNSGSVYFASIQFFPKRYTPQYAFSNLNAAHQWLMSLDSLKNRVPTFRQMRYQVEVTEKAINKPQFTIDLPDTTRIVIEKKPVFRYSVPDTAEAKRYMNVLHKKTGHH